MGSRLSHLSTLPIIKSLVSVGLLPFSYSSWQLRLIFSDAHAHACHGITSSKKVEYDFLDPWKASQMLMIFGASLVLLRQSFSLLLGGSSRVRSGSPSPHVGQMTNPRRTI